MIFLHSALRSTARLTPNARIWFRIDGFRRASVSSLWTGTRDVGRPPCRRGARLVGTLPPLHAPPRSTPPPRPRLFRGLVITALLLGLAGASYVATLRVRARSANNYILSTLVHLQRVNYDYATIDFSSRRAAVEYFAKLSGCMDEIPPDVFAQFVSSMILFAEVRETQGEAVHTIVRDVAEKVNDVLMRNKGGDALETGRTTLLLVLQAVKALKQLVNESSRMLDEEVDEIREKQMKHYLLMKQQAAKENENEKSHEVLG